MARISNPKKLEERRIIAESIKILKAKKREAWRETRQQALAKFADHRARLKEEATA